MIIMNRRTVQEILPVIVVRFLNEWLLRGLVLVSLLLQIELVLLGNRRKFTPGKLLRFTIWLAYTTKDLVFDIFIGVLFKCLGAGNDYSSQQNDMIRAFWLPFLLHHLGGPDTITAYSLADDELWIRPFIHLLLMFLWALSIFLRSWKRTLLNILTYSMFVTGLIKYGEKTLFLKSGSMDHFRDSIIRHPGPEVIDDYIPSPDPSNKSIPDEDPLQKANKFFPKFKRLFTDLVLEPTALEQSKSYFKNISWTEAFQVIEIELGFLYDIFYTKPMKAYDKSDVLIRFICLFPTISTFIGFLIIDKHEYSTTDVIITWLLLTGAIVLEIYSIILLCSSDWTTIWLNKQERTRVTLICEAISSCRLPYLFPANKRWSDSMARYSLISYSLKKLPIKFSEVWKFFRISQMLECSSKNSDVPKYLKKMIFEQLQKKSKHTPGIKEAKELCADRGKRTLEEMKCFSTLHWSIQGEFDECILVWHLATDLCYDTDLNKKSSPAKNSNREASKLLSDYMVYLLLKRPLMLPPGIGQIRFRDSCAKATKIFQTVKDRNIQSCKRFLLQVNTEIPPLKAKGDGSKSVLLDACRLAKSLQSLESEKWNNEKKWEMMSHVWVEMLCYAACHCPRNEHAKELTQGGELLTHVWLLMAHFGITEHVCQD